MLSNQFAAKGYAIIPEYVSANACERLLAAIGKYRKQNFLPLIHRESGARPLHYSVIDGEKIMAGFPGVSKVFEETLQTVNEISGLDLAPLSDRKVACNINITPKGGAYRWHYDRNAVTAILYLNEVEGGETECYPNYRISLNGGSSRLQQPLDRLIGSSPIRSLFGKRLIVRPEAGKLLVMRGDRCLHSVFPVTGDAERINIIMSFDLPGKEFDIADDLNRYLYETEPESARDPNYRH